MSSQPNTGSRHPSSTVSALWSAGHRRLLPLCLAGASLALVSAPSSAEILEAYNDPTLFGTLNQQDVGFIGDTACAPSSVINSFVYLEKRYPAIFGRSLVPEITADGAYDPAELIAAAEVLASADYMDTTVDGTPDTNMAYGKQKYMDERVPGKTSYSAMSDEVWNTALGPKPSWYQELVKPTIDFLYTALTGAFDVEIGVTWAGGTTEGHWITAYGLTFDTETKIGSLSFIDPWKAVDITGALEILGSGKIQLTYTGGAADPGPVVSTIDIIVAEGVALVPEPAVALLFGPGLLTLLVVRRRAKAATAVA